MKTHEIKHVADTCQFSIRDKATGELIRAIGVVAPRPHYLGLLAVIALYETAEAATEVAAAITSCDCEAVQLVSSEARKRNTGFYGPHDL